MSERVPLKHSMSELHSLTQVIWRKQPYKVPIMVGKEQFLEIDRFQLLRIPHKDEWNLLIKNTQPFDSGTYECQVSLKGSLIRRNITLTVTGSGMFDHFISFACEALCTHNENLPMQYTEIF